MLTHTPRQSLEEFFRLKIMKDKNSSIYFIISVLLSIIFIAIAYYTFSRTIVMDDEGWYIYLLRDTPNGASPSQFHKLFHNLFNGDIFLLRVFNYLFELLSIFIYSLGIYVFFNGLGFNFYTAYTSHFFIIVSWNL